MKWHRFVVASSLSVVPLSLVAGPLGGSPAAAAVPAQLGGGSRAAAVEPAGEIVPAGELQRFVDESWLMLDQLSLDFEYGRFGEPTDDDLARLDGLYVMLEDLESRNGEATWADLDAVYRAIDGFASEFYAYPGAGPSSSPVILPTTPVGSDANPVASTTVPAASTTVVVVDDPAVAELTLRTAARLIDEAHLLLLLGIFEDDTRIVEQLLADVGATTIDPALPVDALVERLAAADRRAGEDAQAIAAIRPSVAPEVADAVRTIQIDADWTIDAVRASGDYRAAAYYTAIEALVMRNGRPAPVGSSDVPSSTVADRLRGAYASPAAATEGSADEAVATGAPLVDGAPAPADAVASPSPTAASDTAAASPLVIGLLVALVALVAVLVLLVVTRRRRSDAPAPVEQPGFHDLLDVGRRLSAATSTGEIERMAVQQAMLLTGAVAGAFVRHADRRLEIGFTSESDMLVPDRLGDGILDRVVGAGQELMQISQTEPSIRNLPVSLMATPIVSGGAIVGAIMLLRGADEPFAEHQLNLLVSLKSIVGGAIESAERAKAEASTDGLTKVRNRRALDHDLAELGDDAAIAVVMVDLDHFKAVNDTHGHQSGDDLLRLAADRITANVRPGDQVYRYGGEEFAVVLPDTDEATAAATAERVRAAIADSPFTIGPEAVRHSATASLGVAAGSGGATVIGHADAALYEAKRTGRNRVVSRADVVS